MPALTYDGGDLRLTEPEATPRPDGEARVRMRLAGVCSTDLEIAKGYMGFEGVLGHEFVGDVIESSSASLQGRRVVGRINCGCRQCDACMQDLDNHCPNRSVLGILGRDGVFQESFLLPERNLVVVPDEIPDEHAVFAEPLAAALRIQEQLDVLPWQRVAVIGDGKLGLLITMVLAERIHSVTLFGRHPGRVRLPVSVQERSPEEARDAEFEVVVEATGTPAGLETALRIVRPLGTVVLKTTCASDHNLSLAPVVIDELTIVGSRCGPIEAAIERLAAGTLPVSSLIAARYPLREAADAVRRAMEPGVLKVLIEGTTT